jgi:hypothetical protein
MKKKNGSGIIRLGKENELRKIEPEDKISLTRCRQILKEMGVSYTDEEILLVRDWLYDLAAITYDEYFGQRDSVIIPLGLKIEKTGVPQ